MKFLIENWKEILDVLSHIVFGLSILATGIVRLTPTKTDDEKLQKILQKIHSVFQYLPTFGVNPKTKELEDLMEKTKDVSKS